MLIRAAVYSILMLASLLLSACSSRVEYESQQSRANVSAININTASVEDLEKLPNIGRRTAESIVEFRTQHGPFRRPEQLLQIRGVSEERFAELRPLIKTQ